MRSFFYLCPGEDNSDLIRHFLIESSAKGVHLKGADEEPYFGEPLQPAGRWVGPTLLGWETGLGKAFSRRAAYFLAGSLSAFVCQHSIMALALPCKLTIPQKGGSGPQRGNPRELKRLLVVTSHLIYGLVSQLKVLHLASISIFTSWLENLRMSTPLSLCFLLYEMGTAIIILTYRIGWGLNEPVQARLLSQSTCLINRSLL